MILNFDMFDGFDSELLRIYLRRKINFTYLWCIKTGAFTFLRQKSKRNFSDNMSSFLVLRVIAGWGYGEQIRWNFKFSITVKRHMMKNRFL